MYRATPMANATEKYDPQQYLPGPLTTAEIWWIDHCSWLKSCGYTLRNRYQPDWIPSWKVDPNLEPFYCEDSIKISNAYIIDAVKDDGKDVCLKRVEVSIHPYEVEISSYLGSEELQKDPRNHCVPIIEVLRPQDDPDSIILVMPLLRRFDSPRFDTLGEVVSFIHQIFVGLQFIHEHHIAHRDCKSDNILMDASVLYPEGFHPSDIYENRSWTGRAKHITRTQCVTFPKYYIIDFGISHWFDASDEAPTVMPIMSGDRTAPELQGEGRFTPVNPFPTDVYYIGNLIRMKFVEGSESRPGKWGFDHLKPLIADMTEEDPAKRPTMDEVVARFEKISSSLCSWKLRSRVTSKWEHPIKTIYRASGHWPRRIRYSCTHPLILPCIVCSFSQVMVTVIISGMPYVLVI